MGYGVWKGLLRTCMSGEDGCKSGLKVRRARWKGGGA